MKIYFSNRGNLRNFRGFVEDLDLSEPDILQIFVNERWFAVHPANLVLAAALALKVGKWNSEITGKIPDCAYVLERMELFQFLRTKSPFKKSKEENEGRFIPITLIRSYQEKNELLDTLVLRLGLEEGQSMLVKIVLNELISNALDYSNSVDGVVIAAQYYKKSNKVSLAVCDTGEGMWGSLDEKWHPRNDLEAIHLALTPGVAMDANMDRSSDTNAGNGLFMIKSLARTTRDYLSIYSGTAEFTLLKGDRRLKRRLKGDPTMDAHSETNEVTPFQGTLVALDISLDSLNGDMTEEIEDGMIEPNFQKDFVSSAPEVQDFLNDVSVAYADAVYERKYMNLKEPRLS